MSVSTPAELLAFLQKQGFLTVAQVQELGGGSATKFADARVLARVLVDRNWLTPYQANQLLLGRGNDLLLGSYRILDRLGEGGMGQVFKAYHVSMDRLIALKVIPRDRVSDPNAVARFYREVRAVAKLSHPNIVIAFEVNQVGQTPFLAMEYVDGIDLAKLVQQSGPLPIPRACDYIRQAASGLQHAYEKGLVHRDIKPGNLMVTRSSPEGPPLIKILDFGLARFESENDHAGRLTQLGKVMGTVDYIAPEQAHNSRTADIRADIYGLGCTLFYLLTGRPPFEGPTALQVLAGHLQGEIPSLAGAGAPPELDAVLRRLLAKKPEERFQTPAAVVEALVPFLAGKTGDSSASLRSAVPIGPPRTPGSQQATQEARATAGTLLSQELGSAAAPRRHTHTSALPAPFRQAARRGRPVAFLLAIPVLLGLASLMLLGIAVGVYVAWPGLGSGNRPTDRVAGKHRDTTGTVPVVSRPESSDPPKPKIEPKPEPKPKSLNGPFGVSIRSPSITKGTTVYGGSKLTWGPGGDGPEVVGSGKLDSVTRQVPAFSAISLHHRLGRVTVLPGKNDEVTFKAEDNLLRRLVAEVNDSTLALGWADGSRVLVNQPIEIEVRVKALKRLQLNGGTFEVKEVRAELLEIVLLGNGTVSVSGQADELKLTLSNNGTFRSVELTTKRATLDMKHNGHAVVNVTDQLNVFFGGPAVVEYVGSPNVQTSGKFKRQLKKITVPAR